MLDQAVEKTARIDDMETISEYLLDSITDRATANHLEDEAVHTGSPPSSTYFSGSLSPSKGDFEHDDDDIYSRISPSAIHMFVRAAPSGDTPSLQIAPDFALFYRIFPEWDAQDVDPDTASYRKRTLDIEPATLEFPSETPTCEELRTQLDAAEQELRTNIETALEDIEEEIEADPLQYSSGHRGEQLVADFHAGEFEDEQTYREHAAEADLEPQKPDLDVEVELRALETEDDTVQLKLSLVNQSDESADPDLVEHTIFDANLSVTEGNSLKLAPFRFTRLPEDYRYNRELDGYGVNCSVERVEDGQGDRKTLTTTCLPMHTQYRFRHMEPTDEDAIPKFQTLSEDPIPVLRALKSEMEAYRDREWAAKISELRDISDEVATEAIENRRDFEEEIERFERGITVLEEYDDIRWAFELMNRTFDKKVINPDGSREYESWRLFQIVYLVSNLPDVAAREHPAATEGGPQDTEEVSLLWFPTGGGKTEAYLGLVVTAMHFDRIRGKELGLSSMMRYPLRLLSLQQFQRITELFMYADEIRRDESLGGDQYSVGYLTGGTENKLRDLVEEEFNTSLDSRDTQANLRRAQTLAERWESDSLHSVSRDDHQFLNTCPKCGSDVVTRFNTETLTVDHRCTGDGCGWDRLPVYVIDNEIYRELPSMVVGTQDKLAALGYERKFRLLLGHVEAQCPEHGYTDGTECTEKYFCNIDENDHETLYPRDPVPALQIQDELHLVKEELGTFESHYWSAMEKIIEWAGYEQPKLIAATATIEAYENQIQHLYQRDANLFPAPGPEYRKSFYAEEDKSEVQRYFLGVTPWNRSHINSVVSILEAQQRAVQNLRDNFSEVDEFDLSDFTTVDSREELADLLRFYQTAVSYVISKKEGARIYTSVETQLNEDLARDGYEEIDRMSLTGDSSFSAVSDMLARFEDLPDDPAAADETEEVVIATSTISHGVDLDALNFMVFFGMPRRTAEYIQSSSRVGRKYPGIIVDAFHPIRERDRSHFHYFDKYHEYQDWLVEPVPVNRWAKFSVKRTVPGLFMSLILQRYYTEIYNQIGSPYMTKNVAKAHAKGMINSEQLVDDLCEIYGTDQHDSPVFREEIERKVTQFMSAIDSKQKQFVSDSLPGEHGAMFSLRDVDQSINIFTTKQDGRIVENLADKSGGGD